MSAWSVQYAWPMKGMRSGVSMSTPPKSTCGRRGHPSNRPLTTPNVLRLSVPYAGPTVSVVQGVRVLKLLSKDAMTCNPGVGGICASPARRFDDLTETLFAGHHQPLRVLIRCL